MLFGHPVFHEAVPLQVVSPGAGKGAEEACVRLEAGMHADVTGHVRQSLDDLAAVVARERAVAECLELRFQRCHVPEGGRNL